MKVILLLIVFMLENDMLWWMIVLFWFPIVMRPANHANTAMLNLSLILYFGRILGLVLIKSDSSLVLIQSQKSTDYQWFYHMTSIKTRIIMTDWLSAQYESDSGLIFDNSPEIYKKNITWWFDDLFKKLFSETTIVNSGVVFQKYRKKFKILLKTLTHISTFKDIMRV